MKANFYKKPLLFLTLSLGLFWLANYLHQHVHFNDIDPVEEHQNIQQNLDNKGKQMVSVLEYCRDHKDFYNAIDSIKKEGIYFLKFNNDTLKYWSNICCAFDDILDSVKLGKSFFKIKNAWYLGEYVAKGEETYVALFPVKWEYSIQNNYLVNDFNPLLKIPEGTEMVAGKKNHDIAYHNLRNENIFALKLPMNGSKSNDSSPILLVIYLISLGFLILFIYYCGIGITGLLQSNLSLVIYSVVIVLLRWLSMHYKFPAILYSQKIFDPQYYASSSILKSLGDFLFNAIIVFHLLFFLVKRWQSERWQQYISSKKIYVIPFCVIIIFFLYQCAGLINTLLYGLIINSSISFSISNIFELNSFSLFGFIVMGLLLTSYYIMADGFVRFIIRLQVSFLQLLIYLAGVLVIMTGFYYHSQRWDVATAAFAVIIILCNYLIRRRKTTLFNYSTYLLVISLFSIYSTIQLMIFNDHKERNLRVVLAGKIDKQRDFIAEHLFEDVEEKFKNDENVFNYFLHRHRNDAELERYFHQNYFYGYWNRYDVAIDEFNAKGKPLYDSLARHHLHYYDSLCATHGDMTLSPDLYFINNSSGRTSYIAMMAVLDGKNKNKRKATLIIHINSKFVQEKNGFPELLLTDSNPFAKEFAKYSYARYTNDSLVNQNGDFHYYLSAAAFGMTAEEHTFIQKDGYDHLVYKVNAANTVVMSKKTEDWKGYVILFSYLFTLFCIFILIFASLRNVMVNIRRIQLDFNRRIQFSMLALISISLIIIGTGTIYYIINKYNRQQYKMISEKITTLLVGIENEINSDRNRTASLMVDSLGNPAMLFSTANADYNIYDMTGNLVYTTQPKIYKEGIIAGKMNADAYHSILNNTKTEYIQSERIGNLEFIASYVPIRNKENRVIGFLDLPFFSRQTELKNEISAFVVALINFYILLFAIAIVLALFISNYITQPLRVISTSLRNIRLGKDNLMISVNRKDEIGALVNEYNRMVNELAISADLLVKSERESAWREMAKQVAHEIKNPLTPMKLTIQHLERAWMDHPERMEVMIKKTTATLIEQIDSLSNIATEFANFAVMPKVNNEVLNLAEVVANVHTLYQETEGIRIFLSHYLPTRGETLAPELLVFGDREQLARAFANLIKNGIQAIPEGVKGIINITISEEREHFIVSIADNGTGIPEDKQAKIFNPNFTTKSTGMGLGLAIVKNSIEQMGGSIRFETQKGIGTTFFVTLPKYEKAV